MRISIKNTFSSTALLIPIALSCVLIFFSFQQYLLFHTLAELFPIITSYTMFIVAWQTYPFSKNNYLMYLGIGYFWIANFDLIHTLTYKGISILPDSKNSMNIGSQFWIAGRYLEAFILISAVYYFNNPLYKKRCFLLFGIVSILLATSIFYRYFPDTFVEGEGLTAFKVYSEYLIICALAGLFFYMHYKKHLLETNIYYLVRFAIVLTICAEMSFTLYLDPYGISNLMGHLFKFFSFWMIFISIIRTTLTEPYAVMTKASSTYDVVPDPIVLLDENGVIHQSNIAATEYASLRLNQQHNGVGLHCHDVFHPANIKQQECFICKQLTTTKYLENFEQQYIESDEWYEFTLTKIAPENAATGIVQVMHNITDKKHAEIKLKQTLNSLDAQVIKRTKQLNEKVEELIQTRNELVQSEKMASLGRLVAGFAHEINTPIGVAVGAVSSLEHAVSALNHLFEQEEVDEDELIPHLETLEEAARLSASNLKRAADLVNRFKRTAIDQSTEEQRWFNVKETLNDVIASLHNQFKHTPIKIELDCDKSLIIYSSPGYLDQILTNLLLNSLTHAFQLASKNPKIQINISQQQNRLFLTYQDNGSGIKKEFIGKVFEPFFTTNRSAGGTGLGLYICYNLVNSQLHGEINCSSTEGEGCCFEISYPVETNPDV